MREFSGGIPRATVVRLAIFTEGILLAVSWFWSRGRGVPLPLVGPPTLLLAGVAATVPLLVLNFAVFDLFAARSSGSNVFRRFRDEVVTPLCANLTPAGAAVVALFSGVGEEIFFRGLVNPELAAAVGQPLAVVAGSALFAYVHFVGSLRRYWKVFLFYTMFGLYFSVLALRTESLLPAIVCHALYNFIAILYIRHLEVPRRIRREEGGG